MICELWIFCVMCCGRVGGCANLFCTPAPWCVLRRSSEYGREGECGAGRIRGGRRPA